MFRFKRAEYDLNSIEHCLLPIPVNERDIGPTLIKKANQFVSFKFGDIQLLDTINFVGGATSLHSFLKAYKTSETKGFFPTNGLMQNTELPPYGAFYGKNRRYNPLGPDYTYYVIPLKDGLTPEQAVVKLKLSKPPLLGLRILITCQKYGSRNK